MRADLEAMVETAVRALDPGIAWLLDGHEPRWSKENSLRYQTAAVAAREMIAALGIESLLAEREREVREACAQVVSDFGERSGRRRWVPRAEVIAAIRDSGK